MSQPDQRAKHSWHLIGPLGEVPLWQCRECKIVRAAPRKDLADDYPACRFLPPEKEETGEVLTVDEIEALECVCDFYPSMNGTRARAFRAIRKLNARAGSDGAKGDGAPSPLPLTLPAGTRWRPNDVPSWPVMPSEAQWDPMAHVYRWKDGEPEATWECPPRFIDWGDVTPPAANEMAKCETCRDTGVVGFGRACKRCPACGTGGRPSPETSAGAAVAAGSPSGQRAERRPPDPADSEQAGRIGHRPQGCETTGARPAMLAESARCSGEEPVAGGTDAAIGLDPLENGYMPAADKETERLLRNRIRELEQELYRANERVEDYRRALESEKEGRAESEQRVRELEAAVANLGRERLESHRQRANELGAAEQQLATLKAEKEAAEARVRGLEPVIEAVREYVDGPPDRRTEASYQALDDIVRRYRELRPQSPSAPEVREG